MSKITVQSIADELGLSKFAVSRALNGKSGVSENTRRRIVELAERRGYHPRQARQPGTGAIAIFFRDRTVANRELWIDMRTGLEMQAMRDGYDVVVEFSDDPADVAARAETSAAFVFVGPTPFEMLHAAYATERPVVICAHEVPPLLWIDQVTATDAESGALVGEFLLSLGHTDVVYVHGQHGFPGRHRRLDGLQQALDGKARVDVVSFSEDYAGSELAPALRRLVDDGARPTAFFCGSDGVAVTCLSELQRLGLRIPQDITIVGHADYPVATQVSPNLTTIHVPHREIGMHAVRMVEHRLRAADSPWAHDFPLRVELVCNLVERGSSAEAGTPDWDAALRAVNGTAV